MAQEGKALALKLEDRPQDPHGGKRELTSFSKLSSDFHRRPMAGLYTHRQV